MERREKKKRCEKARDELDATRKGWLAGNHYVGYEVTWQHSKQTRPTEEGV
jgi:hypothetical protein